MFFYCTCLAPLQRSRGLATSYQIKEKRPAGVDFFSYQAQHGVNLLGYPTIKGLKQRGRDGVLSLVKKQAQAQTGENPSSAAGSEGSVIEDEQVCIRRAKRGDSRAFEALYHASVGKVYGLCLRMTGSPAEADDCVQEAFIQAWKKLDKFRGDARFSTWMHSVAVNVVLGRMRKSKREQDRIRAVSELQPAQESIGDSGDLEALEQAMNELPRGARHVFVLHAVYGYSHDETGEMLGIASGTSKAQLHRAKRLLAQQLEPASGAL